MPEPKSPVKIDSRKFAMVCEAALERGVKVRFRAHGKSMQPNVFDGDTVEVAPVAASETKRGDIALTRNERGYLLHRVIDWDAAAKTIVTRGDSGQQNDAPAQCVLGKVISIERNGRRESLEAPGTSLLHATRSLAHRLRRAAGHRARRYRAVLAPAILVLLPMLFCAAPAAAQADLSVSMSAAPNPVATGANITYTETVTNNGPGASTGATVTQSTPPGTLFQSATPPAGWTCGTWSTTS